MLKNKIFLIILTLHLAMPVFSEPFRGFNLEELETINEEPAVESVQQTPIKTDSEAKTDTEVQTDTEVNDVPKVEIQKPAEQKAKKTPYKVPISKKKILGKFISAMFAVGLSSALIYIFLRVYNKMRNDFGTKQPAIPLKKQDLETDLDKPENLTDAVRIFIEKTKWHE